MLLPGPLEIGEDLVLLFFVKILLGTILGEIGEDLVALNLLMSFATLLLLLVCFGIKLILAGCIEFCFSIFCTSYIDDFAYIKLTLLELGLSLLLVISDSACLIGV